MPCFLQISGESFEPSSVPGLAALRPTSTFRRGDKVAGRPRLCEVGGVTLEVSPRDDLIGLVEEAAYYLTKHHDLLRTLAETGAVRYRTLSFQLTVDDFMSAEGRVTLPPLLVRMCAGLDLGMTVCVLT